MKGLVVCLLDTDKSIYLAINPALSKATRQAHNWDISKVTHKLLNHYTPRDIRSLLNPVRNPLISSHFSKALRIRFIPPHPSLNIRMYTSPHLSLLLSLLLRKLNYPQLILIPSKLNSQDVSLLRSLIKPRLSSQLLNQHARQYLSLVLS